MLENLRRKSLVKTYIDPIHEMCFEQGLARYKNHVEIDVCNQKLYQELQESSFKKAIDMISKESFSFFKLNMIYCSGGIVVETEEDLYGEITKNEILIRPFLLGETEITQELYEKVMGKNRSQFKHSQNPVENVSWDDAADFCYELSMLQGLDSEILASGNGYRLPSYEEWKYAFLTSTERNYDSDIPSSKATYPVKSKLPNERGFYGLDGNVSEWCNDEIYDPTNCDVSGSPIRTHVVAGPSYRNYLFAGPIYEQVTCKQFRSWDTKDKEIGFRIARSILD